MRRLDGSTPFGSGWLRAVILVCLLAGCGTPPPLALAPPPLQDDDRYDTAEPNERRRDDYYDVLDYTLFRPVGQWFDIPRQLRKIPGKPYQARNLTAFDEIQDSSWWSNRIGKRPMTASELAQGGIQVPGPDTTSTWRIVRAKTMGVTPGFTIVDGRGNSYVIKFDPLDEPELATGAEIISSRLFWAMGYHVPENHLVVFDPKILEIDPGATVPQFGEKVPMRPHHLDQILNKVPRRDDGLVRALASRYLQGKPIGPFSFHGKRHDDANDAIPHEHRRELRAYRVFAAWLNHNDCRAINTLDTFVERDGRSFVQHNLIDFGATLGSRSYQANLRSEGHEYLWDFGIMARSLVTVGLVQRDWFAHHYATSRGAGWFSAENFAPRDWKPDYPNPAFDNMTQRDAFWAAKIVMRFDDALIRAAVAVADFTDPATTELLTQVIRQRRDRIGAAWIADANALDNFRLVDIDGPSAALQFDDLAVHYGYRSERSYSAVLIQPDGQRQTLKLLEQQTPLAASLTAIVAAGGDAVSERLLRVEIQSDLGAAQWTPCSRVTVYVPVSGLPKIVRVDRDE
jgi:hypothetical protein